MLIKIEAPSPMIMPTITIEGGSSAREPSMLLELVTFAPPKEVELTMAHRPTPVTPNWAIAMRCVRPAGRVARASAARTAPPRQVCRNTRRLHPLHRTYRAAGNCTPSFLRGSIFRAVFCADLFYYKTAATPRGRKMEVRLRRAATLRARPARDKRPHAHGRRSDIGLNY